MANNEQEPTILGVPTEPEIDVSSSEAASETSGEQQPTLLSDASLQVLDESGKSIEAKVIDGDTFTLSDGRTIRDSGVNTSEIPKVLSTGAFSPGGVLGPAQSKIVEGAIKEGGFNKLVTTGKKGKFGRDLGTFARADGLTLSDWLIKERIQDPNKFTTREQMFKRSADTLRDAVNIYGDVADSGQQARDLVNNILISSSSASYTAEIAGSKEEYDAAEFWRSNAGIGAQNDALKAMEKKLKDPKIQGQERLLLEKQLQSGRETQQQWLIQPKVYSGYSGQGKPPKSVFDQIEDSLVSGLYLLENQSANFVRWGADVANSESGEAWSAEWVRDTERSLQKYGGNVGLWEVEGVGSGLQFVGNTISQYGPQLAVVWGGTKAGALAGSAFGPAGTLVGGIVGGLATSFVLSVSALYGEMPEGEKDPLLAAAYAVPMMLLDKYGADKFGLLANKMIGKNVLTKDGQGVIVDSLSEALGISKEAAKKKLTQDIFDITQEAGKTIQALAKDQLIAKRTFKDLVWTAAKASGREAITESVQEGIQYGALALHTSIPFNWKELGLRMFEGGVIGGIAATPFGVVEGASSNAQINQIIYENGPTTKPLSHELAVAENIEARHGTSASHESIVKDLRSENVDGSIKADGEDLGLTDLGDPEQATYWQAFKDVAKKPFDVLKSFKWNIISEDIQDGNGNYNGSIVDIGLLLNEIKGAIGTSIPNAIRGLNGNFLFGLSSEQELAKKAGVETAAELDALLDADYNILTKDQQQVVDQINQENSDLMTKVITAYDEAGIPLSDDQRKLFKDNYLNKAGYLDPNNINEDFISIIANMPIPGVKQPKGSSLFNANQVKPRLLGDAFARKFADNLKNSPTALGTINTANELGLYNDPRFKKFRNLTRRGSALALTNSFSNNIVKQSRIGKDGAVFAKLIQKALNNKEITPAKAAKMAAKLSQYVQMVDGQFNRVHSELIKNIQSSALLMSQFAYMDTNFFANTADLVYGMMRLDKGEFKKYFTTFARSLAKGIYSDVSIIPEKLGGKKRKQKWDLGNEEGWFLGAGKKQEITDFARLRLTGHVSEQGSETLAIEGANVSGKGFSLLSSLLFKMNIVESYTDGTKAAITAVAWDDILRLVSVVSEGRAKGTSNSEGNRFALQRLIGYGTDHELLIQYYKDGDTDSLAEKHILSMNDPESETYQKLTKAYQNALINYTDEFTARPEAGSGWKISEDERLGLFTQYKRFISHFTANIIPKLWKNYVAQGSPKVRYSMFKNIMLTFVMAYAAQHLKDLLKYGEEAPYLEEWDEDFWDSKYGRAARYTGWVGTPEILLESILKYREEEWKSHPQRMLELLLGQSAVLNTAYQIADLKAPLFNNQPSSRTIGERALSKTPFLADIEATRTHLLGL